MTIELGHNTHNKFLVENEQLGPKAEFLFVEKIISIDSEGCKKLFTEGKNGHHAFSEKGKELSKNLWSSILDTAGDDQSADNLTQIARATFESIESNTQDSSKDRNTLMNYLKLATGARIRNQERIELQSEMDTTNSPWKNIVSEIQNLHSDKSEEFVNNFASAWIISLRKKIDKNIESKQDLSLDTRNQLITACETDLADILSKILQYSNEKKLKDIKKNGLKSLLTKSIEQYSDEDNLEDYINYTARIKTAIPQSINNMETENVVYETGSDIDYEKTSPNTGYQSWRSKTEVDKTVSRRTKLANAALLIIGALGLGKGSELITQQDLAIKFANDNRKTSTNEVLSDDAVSSLPTVDNVMKNAQIPSTRNGIKTEIPSTSTATLEPTGTPTASPTPEPTKTYEERLFEKLNYFGLDFSNESKDINFGIQVGSNDFSFSVKPVVRSDMRDKEEFDSLSAPGNDAAGVNVDSYGNVVFEVHSGYTPGIPKKSEMEDWRNWIEGGNLLDIAHINSRLSPEETEERRREMVGTRIPITIDNTTKWFVVKEVGFISHDNLQKHTDDPIDVLRAINPTMENDEKVLDEYGDPISRFDKYADPENPSLMIETCGWGPYGQEGWHKWSRWIIIATPEENQHENTEALSEAKPSGLRKDATQLSEIINSYSEIYPYNGNGGKPNVLLGDYMKSSEWYENKSKEEQEKIERILNRINGRTYAYSNANGVYQAIQCIDYEALLYHLGNGPRYNLVGSHVNVVYPGDALSLSEYSNFSLHSTKNVPLDSLNPGDLLIGAKHVTIVVENVNGPGTELWLADANRKRDGRAEVFKVSSSEEMASILGPTISID